MAKKQIRLGALAGATEAGGEIFGLAANREDLSAFNPNSQYIAVRMLSRRFGFTPSTAVAVAELVGFAAGGAA